MALCGYSEEVTSDLNKRVSYHEKGDIVVHRHRFHRLTRHKVFSLDENSGGLNGDVN